MDRGEPVQHILEYVDGHDDAGVPPAVQGEDGEVGGQKLCGLLGVRCRSCSAAAGETWRVSFLVSRLTSNTHDSYSLNIWRNIMDLCTHLVGHHLAGGRSGVGSQHHAVLHETKRPKKIPP